MSHLYESLHPDDVPPHCHGEPVIEEEPEPESEEGDDDANKRTD